jgi:hypothetical protein
MSSLALDRRRRGRAWNLSSGHWLTVRRMLPERCHNTRVQVAAVLARVPVKPATVRVFGSTSVTSGQRVTI